MSNVQTNNSYFEEKVRLRLNNLPAGECCVLDCFGGDGRIWSEIQKRVNKKRITILRIEKKRDKKGVYLEGDNRKFLKSIDLERFNVIDMDAYGVPYEQLKIIFEHKHKTQKIIFVTFIQTLYGGLPTGMLTEIGYSKKMINKCPALFNKKGIEKLKQYLAKKGIQKIKRFSDSSERKNYLCFEIGN